MQAIFSNPDGDADEEEPFKIDEDEQGFSLRVVPHPGDAEANFVWAELGIRFAEIGPRPVVLASATSPQKHVVEQYRLPLGNCDHIQLAVQADWWIS